MIKFFRFTIYVLIITTVRSSTPEGRIAGGQPVNFDQRQYQVSLMENFDEHMCGGALLSDYWIITSARCVHEYRTLAGLNIRVASPEMNGGNIYPALWVFQHDDYNHDLISSADNVALVKCSSRIWDANTSYVTLPRRDEELPAGSVVTLTGFGSLNASMVDGVNSTYSEYLQEVDLRVWSRAECAETYGAGMINDEMFCAGGDGKGGCEGDHGGPAVIDGVIYGVLSWGQGCGEEYPNVFTKITPYIDWIENIIANN